MVESPAGQYAYSGVGLTYCAHVYNKREVYCMTIYINGHKASKADIALLVSNCKNGIEVITDVHITPRGWLSVSTI